MTRWLSDAEVLCMVLGWFDAAGRPYYTYQRGKHGKNHVAEMAEFACPVCGKVRQVRAALLRGWRKKYDGRDPCCSLKCGQKRRRKTNA